MGLIISCVTPAVAPRKGSTHCASSTVTSTRCASTNRSRTLVSTCPHNAELLRAFRSLPRPVFPALHCRANEANRVKYISAHLSDVGHAGIRCHQCQAKLLWLTSHKITRAATKSRRLRERLKALSITDLPRSHRVTSASPRPAPPGKQRKWPIDRQIVEWSNDLNEKKDSKNGKRQGCHCQPVGQFHRGVIIKPIVR